MTRRQAFETASPGDQETGPKPVLNRSEAIDKTMQRILDLQGLPDISEEAELGSDFECAEAQSTVSLLTC